MADDATRVVEVQLGRPARGRIQVASRCEFGLPMVVRTSPKLQDGTPFPTLYWLTCPMAVKAAGRLESNGFMREMNDRLRVDAGFAAAYAEAHRRYLADRDGESGGMRDSAGGMPGRVKCLHALYAHERAASNPVGALARERIEPLGCPGPCVQPGPDRTPAATPGHPGFKGRRR